MERLSLESIQKMFDEIEMATPKNFRFSTPTEQLMRDPQKEKIIRFVSNTTDIREVKNA